MTEFCCLECRARITRGPDGTEYGHRRYGRRGGQRCSRRPQAVDPQTAQDRRSRI
jgi:hypothetical protein